MLKSVDYPDVVKTFLEVIKIDNPSKEEDELVLWLVDKLNSIGVESIMQDTFGNVIAKIDANVSDNSNTIMFITHLDSVHPCRAIKPKIDKDDQDYTISSGPETILSADDKAGVVAIVEAVKILKKQNIEHCNIGVSCLAGRLLGGTYLFKLFDEIPVIFPSPLLPQNK